MKSWAKAVWLHKGKITAAGILLYAGLGLVLGLHDYNRAVELVTSAVAAFFVGG